MRAPDPDPELGKRQFQRIIEREFFDPSTQRQQPLSEWLASLEDWCRTEWRVVQKKVARGD